MAPRKPYIERQPDEVCEPLATLVRLLARQAAAEMLDAAAIKGASETPPSSEAGQ